MKERANHDVVLSIHTNGVAADKNKGSGSGIELRKQGTFSVNAEMPFEFTMMNPMSTSQKPSKFPSELIRKRAALARLAFSESKSRFSEPPYPYDEALADQRTYVVGSNTFHTNSTNFLPRVSMATPKATPLTQGKDEENDEDVYKFADLQSTQPFRKKLKLFDFVEMSLFVILMSLSIASLIDYNLQNTSVWNLELWKWCVLLTVIFCGRLVTKWFIGFLVYLVERKLHFTKKAPYFVNGLKKSVQAFLWFSFVLLAWILLVIHGSNRSRKATKVLHYITVAIAGCIVGAVIRLVKTLLIKALASSFHVKRFFKRIQESIFHQYVLQTLSGPPFVEKAGRVARSRNISQLSLERMTKDQGIKEEVINVGKLQHMNKENVSAWTLKGLIKVVRRTKLSIISDTTFDSDEDNGMGKQEIKHELQAKFAAVKIFNNVAKPGYEYIEEEDLLRFMKMDEIAKLSLSLDGFFETGKIKKSSLEKWVVNAYLERKSLAHSLNDTKTAVDMLNILASGVVLIVNVIVWNLMMGFLSTKLLIFVTTQLLLAGFMFKNSVKTVFEAIIFIFVMHPFDVGDRCVIDGVQMAVEEMNILTTIFLRHDNAIITYPNSVLANKPISNFYRSPAMHDSVEFAINLSTTVEVIAALKDRIKSYIESKPQHWRPCHSVQLKEIVDMNKIKMTLYVTHTINFQNIVEKNCRTSDLVLELKRAFEELGIRYHLLPQEVHVTYVGSPASASIA